MPSESVPSCRAICAFSWIDWATVGDAGTPLIDTDVIADGVGIDVVGVAGDDGVAPPQPASVRSTSPTGTMRGAARRGDSFRVL